MQASPFQRQTFPQAARFASGVTSCRLMHVCMLTSLRVCMPAEIARPPHNHPHVAHLATCSNCAEDQHFAPSRSPPVPSIDSVHAMTPRHTYNQITGRTNHPQRMRQPAHRRRNATNRSTRRRRSPAYLNPRRPGARTYIRRPVSKPGSCVPGCRGGRTGMTQHRRTRI